MRRETRWLVVKTQPRREAWAKINCERQGAKIFLPYCRNLKKVEPLFPGYFFMRWEERWYFLKGTFGVMGVIMRGEEPETIGNRWILDIKQRMDRDGFVQVDRMFKFDTDAQVRIKAGPWMNAIGKVVGYTAQHRVMILLQILGQQVVSPFSESELSAA